MKLVRINHPYKDGHKPCSVCFGYFDGLHKGHIQLVKQAINEAKKRHILSALFTFEPNPDFVLGKTTSKEMLTTLEDRYARLKEFGMDEMMIVNFTREVARLSPEEFVEEFIIGLNVKAVVVGYDFGFGFKGEGDYKTLQDLSKGRYDVVVVEEIDQGGLKISSTRIIQLLKSGNIDVANQLLGYPYSIKGKVMYGQGRGKKLNFPTINIKSSGLYIFPRRGVYACKVRIDGTAYFGMGNVGCHPTIDKLEKEIIEVHIFDFNREVYEKEAEISFYHYIREEIRFDSLDNLTIQIKKDEISVMEYFKI